VPVLRGREEDAGGGGVGGGGGRENGAAGIAEEGGSEGRGGVEVLAEEEVAVVLSGENGQEVSLGSSESVGFEQCVWLGDFRVLVCPWVAYQGNMCRP